MNDLERLYAVCQDKHLSVLDSLAEAAGLAVICPVCDYRNNTNNQHFDDITCMNCAAMLHPEQCTHEASTLFDHFEDRIDGCLIHFVCNQCGKSGGVILQHDEIQW